MAEDAVCENGAQEAGADEDGGAERGGFLGSADVIVEFWGHLDGVRFYLAVYGSLLWDLRCKIEYICSFLRGGDAKEPYTDRSHTQDMTYLERGQIRKRHTRKGYIYKERI